jgi:hypothetical protein
VQFDIGDFQKIYQENPSLIKMRQKYWALISGFRHNVDEICALREYYAVLSGNSVLTFWDSLSVPTLGR